MKGIREGVVKLKNGRCLRMFHMKTKKVVSVNVQRFFQDAPLIGCLAFSLNLWWNNGCDSSRIGHK
jgi:hypothetical protein